MNKIKQAYYYFIYKIYKAMLWTSAPFGNFFSNFRASLVMMALELWIVFTVLNYYEIINNSREKLSLGSPVILIPLLIIIILNYITFNRNDYVWEKYNAEFDNLPRKKNLIGSWIVFTIVLLIISNFIFSFYCLDQQAKKNQIGPYAPEIVAKKRMEDSLQKAQQIENLKKIYGEDKK